MTSVAALGFAIDSSPAASAASDLDKMTASAVKAEQAAGRTSSAGTKMSRSFSDLGPTLERLVLGVERVSQSTMLIEKRLAAQGKAASMAANQNRALDASLTDTSSAYKALEASLRAVETAQQKGDASLKNSLATIDKQREAIAKLNAELTKLQNHPAGAPPTSGGGGKPANTNFQATNAMFQYQDILMTAAGGMNAGMIGLQQGSQLAGAYAGMSMKEAATTSVGAITQLLNPVSLAAVGLTTAAAAAVQFGISLAGSEEGTSKAAKAFDNYVDVIKRVKDAYGDAADGLDRFTQENKVELGAATRKSLIEMQVEARKAGKELSAAIGVLQARTGGASDIITKYRPFTVEIQTLRAELKAGTADYEAFQRKINDKANKDPSLRVNADELIAESVAANRAKQSVDQLKASVGLLGSTAVQQLADLKLLTNALNDLSQIAPADISDDDRIKSATSRAMAGFSKADPILFEENRRRLMAAQNAANKRLGNQNPTVTNPQGMQVPVPIPERKPVLLGDAVSKEVTAYDRLVETSTQRIENLKLEATLAGETGVAADTMRFRLDLLHEAQKKGADITAGQREQIDKLTESYRQAADAASSAKMAEDLAFNGRQLQRTPDQQRIAATLRQYGKAEDFSSIEAGQIRQQMQFAEVKAGVKSFGQEFTQTFLSQGGSIGERFGKSMVEPIVGTAHTFQFPFSGEAA